MDHQSLNHRSLEIELTTKCTLFCPGCPRTYRKKLGHHTPWNSGHVDKQVILNTLDDPYFHSVRFVGSYGDAIYHPSFIEVMDKACNVDKRILLHTNGTYRKKEFWQELSKLPWDRIPRKRIFNFSVDGLSDTNHIYRKGADWDWIMTAVDILASAKQRPKLVWQFLVFPYNKHQVEEAKSMYKSLGFDSFEYSKSLRKYHEDWFESENERRQIDYNYA